MTMLAERLKARRGKRGEAAAIVPSELKPGRKMPFADDEFWAELARIRA